MILSYIKNPQWILTYTLGLILVLWDIFLNKS
jgi:hypothetical protein